MKIEYEFELVSRGIPDIQTVLLERKIARSLTCKVCNKEKAYFILSQKSIYNDPNSDCEEPIIGDLLFCKCLGCGNEIWVECMFNFIKDTLERLLKRNEEKRKFKIEESDEKEQITYTALYLYLLKKMRE